MDPVDEYLNALSDTLAKISRRQVWAAVEILLAAWRSHKQVFILGNGGSAATATHMANDLNKFTIVAGKSRFRAFSLSDNIPLITAWANDSSFEHIFSEQLENHLHAGDVVIAISASGNSANIINGLKLARQRQAVTIGLTGDNGGMLKHLVDCCVFIPDAYIGRQEDGHMILDHLIVTILRKIISGDIAGTPALEVE